MFDFLSNAWDSFTGLFSSGDTDGSTIPSSLTEGQRGILEDIDINNDGGIGSTNFDLRPSFSSVPTAPTPQIDPKNPWYTNPNLLGAGITAGAGLFQGMSTLDLRKEELAASKEAQKMNNLLELAKLKNSILAKGAGGGRRAGGGRSGGSGAASKDDQYSANKISALSNLGSNLATIYRG